MDKNNPSEILEKIKQTKEGDESSLNEDSEKERLVVVVNDDLLNILREKINEVAISDEEKRQHDSLHKKTISELQIDDIDTLQEIQSLRENVKNPEIIKAIDDYINKVKIRIMLRMFTAETWDELESLKGLDKIVDEGINELQRFCKEYCIFEETRN